MKGIYPKKRKFALGGFFESFTDPANGGYNTTQYYNPIQFVPTKPVQVDPNLFKPMARPTAPEPKVLDPEDLKKLGLQAHSGVTSEIIGEHNAARANYQSKLYKDPYYAFSPEGQDELRKLNNGISYDKVINYRNVFEHNSKLYDSDRARIKRNDLLVKNGRVVVFDNSTNSLTDVDKSDYDADKEGKYAPVDRNDIYRLWDKDPEKGRQYLSYDISAGKTWEEAGKDVTNMFSNLGTQAKDTETKSSLTSLSNAAIPIIESIKEGKEWNAPNRQAVVDNLLDVYKSGKIGPSATISQDVRDAFDEEMLKKGYKNEADRAALFVDWVSNLSESKKIDKYNQSKQSSLLPERYEKPGGAADKQAKIPLSYLSMLGGTATTTNYYTDMKGRRVQVRESVIPGATEAQTNKATDAKGKYLINTFDTDPQLAMVDKGSMYFGGLYMGDKSPDDVRLDPKFTWNLGNSKVATLPSLKGVVDVTNPYTKQTEKIEDVTINPMLAIENDGLVSYLNEKYDIADKWKGEIEQNKEKIAKDPKIKTSIDTKYAAKARASEAKGSRLGISKDEPWLVAKTAMIVDEGAYNSLKNNKGSEYSQNFIRKTRIVKSGADLEYVLGSLRRQYPGKKYTNSIEEYVKFDPETGVVTINSPSGGEPVKHGYLLTGDSFSLMGTNAQVFTVASENEKQSQPIEPEQLSLEASAKHEFGGIIKPLGTQTKKITITPISLNDVD